MKRWAYLVALLSLGWASTAVAGRLTIQGHLGNGGASVEGPHQAVFTFYDAQTGGGMLWTETDTIQVQSCLFTSILGLKTTIPDAVFSGAGAWLETALDGNTLSPRVGYFAQPVNVGAGQWQADETNVWRSTGKVGIGTAAPNYAVHVAGADHQACQMVASDSSSGNVVAGYRFGRQYPSSTQQIWAITMDPEGTGTRDLAIHNYPPAGGVGTAVSFQHGTGNVGIGTESPDTRLDVRGPTEITDDSATPDTRNYATLGVTRAYSPANQSYIGLTQQSHFPWGIGIDGASCFIVGDAASGRTLNPYLSIAPSGNVSIGAPTHEQLLGVSGMIGIYPKPWVQPTTKGMFLYNEGTTGSIFAYDYPNNHAMSIGMAGSAVTLDTYGPSGEYQGPELAVTPGNVHIYGTLTVDGSKCRAVNTPYGQLRLNAVESGHALFMDDGASARLVNGRRRVNLQPKFLATVTVDEVHPLIVNVTFYGPHGEGWYVERDRDGFTVIDPSGGNAEFSWTATARQKGYEDTYLDQGGMAGAGTVPARDQGGQP